MTGKTHASCGFLVGALTTQYFHTDLFYFDYHNRSIHDCKLITRYLSY